MVFRIPIIISLVFLPFKIFIHNYRNTIETTSLWFEAIWPSSFTFAWYFFYLRIRDLVISPNVLIHNPDIA